MAERGERRLVAATLAAIQEGRLPVEDVVRAGLRGCAPLAGWLNQRLREQAGAPPRGLALRRRKRFPAEVVARARATAAKRFADRGAVAVAWGVAQRRGLSSGEPALVVLVDEKRPLAELPAGQRLPRNLRVRHGGRSFEVPIDVRRVARGQKEVDHRPGDRCLVEVSGGFGTISAILDDESRASAIVSGHVAIEVGARARAWRDRDAIDLGRVAKVRDDSSIDAARIDGVDPDHVALLSSPPADLYDLGPDDLTLRLTVRRADGEVFGHVSAIEEYAVFGGGAGEASPMDGLVRLDGKVTRRGDSGAPVFDPVDRLVGFVIGSANGHTYVIPARRVFDAME